MVKWLALEDLNLTTGVQIFPKLIYIYMNQEKVFGFVRGLRGLIEEGLMKSHVERQSKRRRAVQ